MFSHCCTSGTHPYTIEQLKAYGRFCTDPAIRQAAAPEEFIGAINNEDRSIQRSLMWMPKGCVKAQRLQCYAQQSLTPAFLGLPQAQLLRFILRGLWFRLQALLQSRSGVCFHNDISPLTPSPPPSSQHHPPPSPTPSPALTVAHRPGAELQQRDGLLRQQVGLSAPR